MRAFHWWRSGNKKRTQNVSEYMLVLALCLVVFLIKAKFHYASWFEAGSKLVADQFRTCLRTSFEPASVMEFGF